MIGLTKGRILEQGLLSRPSKIIELDNCPDSQLSNSLAFLQDKTFLINIKCLNLTTLDRRLTSMYCLINDPYSEPEQFRDEKRKTQKAHAGNKLHF